MTVGSAPGPGRRLKASHNAIRAVAAIEDPKQRDQEIDRFLGSLAEEMENWQAEESKRVTAEIERATAAPERWLRLCAGYGSVVVGLGAAAMLMWLVIDGYTSGKLDFVRNVLSSGIVGVLLGGIGMYYFRSGRKWEVARESMASRVSITGSNGP